MKIKKMIMSIFVASFIGIMANPEMLAASNSVAVKGVSRQSTVRTILPEPVPQLLEEPAEALQNAARPVFEETQVPISYQEEIVAPEVVYTAPENNLQIAGKTLEVVQVDSTQVDSGTHVNKYGDKFYWGHNTEGVFRGLYQLETGDGFTITENGVKTAYKITERVVFKKNFETGTLQLNGKGNYMLTLVNGRYDGKNYDVVLMTCYGQTVGADDATERLVLLAKAM